MRRFLKILVILILIIFVAAQFYPRPAKNTGKEVVVSDLTMTTVPVDVQHILKSSCYDCHSNSTNYPWYANIQPVAWWLGDHITEGKKELNFSEFASYTIRRKFKKYSEIVKEVEENEMPLPSYEIIHREASLDSVEKQLLINWANSELESMRKAYPSDSLISKK